MLKKLSLLFLVCLMFFAVTQVALAKDETEKDKGDDEAEEVTIPDWDNPYEIPADIQEAIDEAESCDDLLKARINRYKDEARYWRGIAVTDSNGAQKMQEALTDIQDLQLKIAKKRSSLEKKSKDRSSCITAKSQDAIQEALKDIQNKINAAGYYIYLGGDKASLTDDDSDSRCAKASVLFSSLEEDLADTKNKLATKILEGNLDKSAYATEILKIAEDNYVQAYELDQEYSDGLTNEEKMRICTGIIDESNLGLEMLSQVKDHYKGKKENKGSDFSNLEAMAKMMLAIVAEKQVEALALVDETEKQEVLDGLNDAKDQILEIQKCIAGEKYDKKQTNYGLINSALQHVKKQIKEIDQTLYGADMEELTKKEKRAKVNKLISSATSHIKTLRTRAANKAKKDDLENEKDYVKYAKQSLLKDAVSAKKAAKSLKKSKEYDEALENLYTAIQTAKNGQEILKEVQ